MVRGAVHIALNASQLPAGTDAARLAAFGRTVGRLPVSCRVRAGLAALGRLDASNVSISGVIDWRRADGSSATAVSGSGYAGMVVPVLIQVSPRVDAQGCAGYSTSSWARSLAGYLSESVISVADAVALYGVDASSATLGGVSIAYELRQTAAASGDAPAVLATLASAAGAIRAGFIEVGNSVSADLLAFTASQAGVPIAALVPASASLPQTAASTVQLPASGGSFPGASAGSDGSSSGSGAVVGAVIGVLIAAVLLVAAIIMYRRRRGGAGRRKGTKVVSQSPAVQMIVVTNALHTPGVDGFSGPMGFASPASPGSDQRAHLARPASSRDTHAFAPLSTQSPLQMRGSSV
jgi:hypothetical protein